MVSLSRYLISRIVSAVLPLPRVAGLFQIRGRLGNIPCIKELNYTFVKVVPCISYSHHLILNMLKGRPKAIENRTKSHTTLLAYLALLVLTNANDIHHLHPLLQHPPSMVSLSRYLISRIVSAVLPLPRVAGLFQIRGRLGNIPKIYLIFF
jgi:hypothetical protein